MQTINILRRAKYYSGCVYKGECEHRKGGWLCLSQEGLTRRWCLNQASLNVFPVEAKQERVFQAEGNNKQHMQRRVSMSIQGSGAWYWKNRKSKRGSSKAWNRLILCIRKITLATVSWTVLGQGAGKQPKEGRYIKGRETGKKGRVIAD